MAARQLLRGDGPVGHGVVEAEAADLGVDELDQPPAAVHGDDAAARPRRVTLLSRGAARDEEREDARPVGGGEAFRANVGREHGRSLDRGLARTTRGSPAPAIGGSGARAGSILDV